LRSVPRSSPALALCVLAVLLAGCGRSEDDSGGNASSDLSGRIVADGSSTVGPLVSSAAERFEQENGGVRVTVGISGTGGGFERFCRGETDLSNASRAIEEDEQQACDKKGIEFVELQVANDGIVIVVNKGNDWASCVTTAQLKKIWNRGSKVDNWNEIDPTFEDERLTLAGPGTDSGTFDFFTEAINGEEGVSRSDYQATEDDNVVVEAVSGDRGGLGYFGLSYYEQNKDNLKALEVDGGGGCVAPSVETVQSGGYKPLSRPLFVYVNKDALARPEAKAFLEFMLDNQGEIAEDALFVPLTDAQVEKARSTLEQAA
jgi:phosphate transport system substrate-binding protein